MFTTSGGGSTSGRSISAGGIGWVASLVLGLTVRRVGGSNGRPG
jgi:hypothetical protein